MVPRTHSKPRLVSHNGGNSAPRSDGAPTGLLCEEDRQLAKAVRRGDTRVADRLHNRLIGPIDHAVVRVFGERTTDHEDLLQSCFEQVVISLARGNFAGNCSLATWAGRIASHVALNALRARIRERSFFERGSVIPEPPGGGDEERRARARLDLMRVRKVLVNMNPRRAEVLVLHDLHGYQLSEIASMLEITVSAAQSRLVRGRSEMLRRLESKRPWPLKGGVS